jgi:LacI family transcriptional regulator
MSTIKDVARAAGVGVATASRALSGRGSVSALTVDKVRRVAADLSYRPSAIAQALSLQQSGALGMFVPAINDSFYANILSHADQVLRAHGKHLIIVTGVSGQDARDQALDAIDFLLGRDCDGLFISGYHLADKDITILRKRQPKLVMVNRSLHRMRSLAVEADHEMGGRLAARALIERGHCRLALVQGLESALDNQDRVRGFLAECKALGASIDMSFEGDFTRQQGFQAGEQFAAKVDRHLSADQRCTAVFCANDRMASGFISSLTGHGWRLPEDLSVIGYDDDDMSPYATPALTTVHIPIGLMAENAAALLLNECYGMELPVVRRFQPHVVWRRSVQDGPFPPGSAPVSPLP